MFPTKGQIITTKALLKFCQEHGHNPNWLLKLEDLLSLLESNQRKEFFEKYELFKKAGMGSFLDWFPEKSFKHETTEYVEVIWHALVGHWYQQIEYFENTK